MIYALVIIASFAVYSVKEGPKHCEYATNQNAMVTDNVKLIVAENGKKCFTTLHLEVKITPEDNADFLTTSYTVKLVSEKRGVLQQQIVTGSPRVRFHEQMVVKKKDKIWVEISSTGKYLVSLQTTY